MKATQDSGRYSLSSVAGLMDPEFLRRVANDDRAQSVDHQTNVPLSGTRIRVAMLETFVALIHRFGRH